MQTPVYKLFASRRLNEPQLDPQFDFLRRDDRLHRDQSESSITNIAHACDGRQMSIYDFDHMEDFESRFRDTSLNEDSFRKLVEDFGNCIPEYLTRGPVDIPERALQWTQQDANI